MPVKQRQLRVAFYALEPGTPFDGQKTFPLGRYPLAEVRKRIRKMDPASEEYRVRESMFGGETLCLFHGDASAPLLGAYYRDHLAKAMTEYKGEVAEIPLRDGEALVDASFVGFFPEDVVGLVRTSSKSPGFARIGQWLTVVGTYACQLVALPDVGTWKQLEADSTKLTRLSLRARREQLPHIEQLSGPNAMAVAQALRMAADVDRATDQVGIEWRMTRRKDQAMWSRNIQHQLYELLNVLPTFEEAKVHVKGRKRPVDLKRSYVQHTVDVALLNTKRVGPEEAATAILDAYEREEQSIAASLHAARNAPDEWETSSDV